MCLTLAFQTLRSRLSICWEPLVLQLLSGQEWQPLPLLPPARQSQVQVLPLGYPYQGTPCSCLGERKGLLLPLGFEAKSTGIGPESFPHHLGEPAWTLAAGPGLLPSFGHRQKPKGRPCHGNLAVLAAATFCLRWMLLIPLAEKQGLPPLVTMELRGSGSVRQALTFPLSVRSRGAGPALRELGGGGWAGPVSRGAAIMPTRALWGSPAHAAHCCLWGRSKPQVPLFDVALTSRLNLDRGQPPGRQEWGI